VSIREAQLGAPRRFPDTARACDKASRVALAHQGPRKPQNAAQHLAAPSSVLHVGLDSFDEFLAGAISDSALADKLRALAQSF